jgi:hypothetical protein
MLNASWSWDDIHHPLPPYHLTTAIDNLGLAIVDDGAVAAITDLFKRGWMFNTTSWRLAEFVLARLLQSNPVLTNNPHEATLILLNGNTTGSRRYLQQQQQKASANNATYQPHHFGIVPYGKSLTVNLLSEYRLDDPKRVLIRLARSHPGDITAPYLTEINPHGYAQLSDLDIIYRKPRRWLVSFVGSPYQPGEPKAPLTLERYDVLRGLVECNWKYMTQGVDGLRDRNLRDVLESNAFMKQPGLNMSQLVLMPMTAFPNKTGLNARVGLRAKSGFLQRTEYNRKSHAHTALARTNVGVARLWRQSA